MPTSDAAVTKTVYWPNRESYRKRYLQHLYKKETLYWDTCVSLPRQDRAKCDSSKNWSGILAVDLDCSDVSSCNVSEVKIPEHVKRWATSQIDLKDGALGISPEQPLSLNDPIGWGMVACSPLFFFLVFLGIKLGIAVRELLFFEIK